jgi:nucleotide-binding universal stress UspA family protein
MAFKDILLLLDPHSTQAGEYAVALASSCAAHITAATLVVEPEASVGFLDDSATFLASALEDARLAAHRMLEEFASRARRAGIMVETEVLNALAGRSDRARGPLARHFDLVVVEQPDLDFPRPRASTIEAVLFGSGRPVLVVPTGEAAPFRLEHVLVAWDGSATAARALGDAMPFLARAKRVELVTVADAGDELDASGHRIARHLARHGLETEFHRLPSAGSVGSTLLAHASDCGTDLMVMGGYGHSRFRELILGGATRDILAAMTLPVLMSH